MSLCLIPRFGSLFLQSDACYLALELHAIILLLMRTTRLLIVFIGVYSAYTGFFFNLSKYKSRSAMLGLVSCLVTAVTV